MTTAATVNQLICATAAADGSDTPAACHPESRLFLQWHAHGSETAVEDFDPSHVRHGSSATVSRPCHTPALLFHHVQVPN